MQETQRVLLQLPVPLSTFVKVKVQVPAQTSGLPTGHAAIEDTAMPSSLNLQMLSLIATSSKVQQKQPGGPLIAHPCTAGHCQVICHKVRLASLRKKSALQCAAY